MNTVVHDYYEQQLLWSSDRSQGLIGKIRLQKTIELIPLDTQSVLDVGCGNGFLVNTLHGRYSKKFEKITGLDSSDEALRHVRSEKFKGNASLLPFEDGSYDLVTALEVLEHLQERDFQRALAEIQRVSRKHIIVSVPNSQDIIRLLVICPKCCCCFNPSFHVRSFDKDKLVRLFSSFELIEFKEVGPLKTVRTSNRLLARAYLGYKLFFRQVRLPSFALCPQCGYQHQPTVDEIASDARQTQSSKLVSLGIYLVGLMTKKTKKKTHLLALYARKDQTKSSD